MKNHSINTMKPLSILAILFLVIAIVHANTNSDDNNQQDESSSSNLGRHNPLIRLPTETSDLDLTELLNRRRVNLRNRYRVPLTRYVPRRCRHRFAAFPTRFTKFGPGVAVDPKDDLATIMKKQAEVIRHRHVDGKFDPIKREAVVYEVKEEYDGGWKAGRPHHHHGHHHDHDHSDDSDDSDDEGDKVHDEVHAHRFNHHGHKKKKGNYIMRTIRKFLSNYF